MDFKTFRSNLNEDRSINDELVPAPMLVLRRRGVRIFPDGRKVALYVNDKYNLTFTVPYGGHDDGDPVIVGQHSDG